LILISATVKPGALTLAIILGFLSWPPIARGIRAQCLSIQQKPYIKSVQHLGGGFFYILKKHIIPEIFPLFIIGFSSKMRVAVIMEATLAFLGLVDPSRKSLGHIINYSMKYYYLDVWTNWIIPPLVLLSLIILSVTFIAIGMETVFSPELKKTTRIREI
ncbi:MAG: ABC transporter permease subunit, partial [Spirochaetaceae bacterium]|nr:ABC transporter permease subunit [Spirochaetaceae bacterium]